MINSALATPATINITTIRSSTTVVRITDAFFCVFVVLFGSDSSDT
jgi:hypothetical protein